jgi:phosphoglycerate kinase
MDAFSAAHRAHATTRGVTKFLPAYAGFLLEKEVSILGSVRDNPEPPLALILGGSKVTDKIGVIEHMANKASTILVGGAMAFPFLVAKGYSVGKSKCDEENVTCARHILKVLEDEEVEIILPVDIVVGESMNSQQASGVVKVDNVPDNMMGLDIGPQTVKEFSKHLGKAKSIIWNGPLGLFENPAFSRGTMEIGKIVSEKAKEGAVVVIGGGDTAAAAKALGFASGVTHVSTGGGASLEFLEGKILPGIEPLLE